MSSAALVVTLMAAAANSAAAAVDFASAEWVLANMTRLSIPHSWLPPLGALKAAGALGLLVGIGIRPIGIAASIGLVLYFEDVPSSVELGWRPGDVQAASFSSWQAGVTVLAM